MADDCNSYEYEHKLYSLKILNEAQKLGLINKDQYTTKQNEFLRSIHFSIDEEDDEANSSHAAELLHRTSQAYGDEEYRPSRAARKRTSYRLKPYEFGFEEQPPIKRRRVRKPVPLEGEGEMVENMVGPDGELIPGKTEGGSPLLEGYESPKDHIKHHKTFSEFIFAALRHLGGEAELQELYQYVYDNREDIDPRFSYRFKTGDYKSNVRSTLHNTGSFHKNSNGKWTIDAPLKGRGR